MSDKFEQTREVAAALVALMKKYSALITLDSAVHAIQVVYLPQDLVDKAAETVANRFMYNVLMEGEIGFSEPMQKQLGLDEPTTQVPPEDIEKVRKLVDYARYFQEDNPNWLKDLGIDGEEDEKK